MAELTQVRQQQLPIQAFIEYMDRKATTTKVYVNNLRQFVAWLSYKGINPADIERQDVLNYRDWMLGEHEAVIFDAAKGWAYRTKNGQKVITSCKPSTTALYLRSVRTFFKWLGRADIVENIHTPKVSDNFKKDALKQDAVVKIEESITAKAADRQAYLATAEKDKAGKLTRAKEQDARLAAMYQLAVNLGLRTIELHRANVGDIEVVDGVTYMAIWGKGRDEADTKKAIASGVAETLNSYLALRGKPAPSEPLFTSTGNRSKGKRIATTTISTMLKRAMIDAGYDSARLTAHSLRHTAGTAVNTINGRNIYATQKFMRHASPATTEHYTHDYALEDDRKAAEELYSYYHGQSKSDNVADMIGSLTADQQAQLAKMIQVMF